jgi:hypothetical protein
MSNEGDHMTKQGHLPAENKKGLFKKPFFIQFQRLV